ncbi:MobP2 family relaxase [Enterococcus hirae]|uniref:MobP2 family relaxase n=1 Tax=Enterococcus hirae TaxID=1354 RepID=UPI002DBCA00A|nr:MobP2 family relaxase [Enterococcus hirae]
MGSPGIIMTGKFARPGSSAFQSYIDYMDREEAIRNEAYDSYSAFTNKEGTNATYEGDEEETLEGYIRYMANPNKTSRLFSNDKHRLDENDVKEMKKQFTAAAKNGSAMWQDVFSFDNQWLVQHGYLDPKTNQLDEEKIHYAVRLAMTTMLEEEKMSTSAVWTASIHYNTDNIHVHVATVEPYPTRELKTFIDSETGEKVTEVKGYRSKKTIRKMKSSFANQLLGLQKERAQIDSLKKIMIEGIRSEQGKKQLHEMSQNLIRVAEKLPPQKGYQKYGYAEKFGFKQELDKVIKQYISTNYPELFQEIIQKQTEIQVEEEAAFGEGRNSSENKLNTLFTRLGNTILKEIQLMDLSPKRKQVNGNLNQSILDDVQQNSQSRIGENKNEPSEAFQRALELIAKNPYRHRANEPPVLENLLSYIRSEEQELEKVEQKIDEIDTQKETLKKQLKEQVQNNQSITMEDVEKLPIPPNMQQHIFTISKQELLSEQELDDQIEDMVEQILPKKQSISDYQKEFIKSMKEAVEKIETNPFRHKENEPPTKEEWERYIKTLQSTIPNNQDSYEKLFEEQPKELKAIYQDSKKESKRNGLNKTIHSKKRKPKFTQKERMKLQKEWRKKVENRRQFYQLQRTLRDQTQQWQNERFYERNILDLSI